MCTTQLHTKPLFLYAGTHNVHACQIVHQNELIKTFANYLITLYFTIITEVKKCVNYFSVSPCSADIYKVFYVDMLPCPVGFTVRNGVCDCDPYLSSSNINSC